MATKKPTKPWTGSKADEAADKKIAGGLSAAGKAKFAKADEKMDKNKNLSKSQDTAKDKALAAKLKREEEAKKKKAASKKK